MLTTPAVRSFSFLPRRGSVMNMIMRFARKVDEYIKTKAENFIFLYGEYDPWSATAADPGKNNKVLKIVKAGGAHGTRIRNLSDEQRELVYSKLEEWLDVVPAEL